MRPWRSSVTGLVAGAGLVVWACGSEAPPPKAPGGPTTAVSKYDGGADSTRCDYRGRNDREVVEGRGPGATAMSIRKVYATVGQGEDARKVLVCREVDTNLDGVMDIVRTYNDKGEVAAEQADTTYDGVIDTWLAFSKGRIIKRQADLDGDGRPDETGFYVDGKLNRVQRDTNRDGKPDVWEIYDDGRLERMGVDLDRDGHVDRWDRDQVALRRLDEEEKARERAEEQRREEEEKKRASDAADGGHVTDARVSARKR